MKKLNVFLPAAGFGKRMGTLTENIPKPLLPLGGYPMIDYAVYLAEKWGCGRLFINAHYKKEQIERYTKTINLECIYCAEEEILGTAGGMKTCIDRYLTEDDYFVVINPDLLIFPEKGFHPLAEDFQDDILLYLQKNDSDNTSLSLQNGNVYFANGDLYYIGLSVIRFGVLREIVNNTYSDLADIFRKYSRENMLEGRMFPGEVFDLGNRDLYEKQKNLDIFRYIEKNDWENFRKRIFPGS